MKIFMMVFALSFFYGCQEAPEREADLSKSSQINTKTDMPEELKDPEDCEDKAKSAEEVVEVNLQGGNDAGCTIE